MEELHGGFLKDKDSLSLLCLYVNDCPCPLTVFSIGWMDGLVDLNNVNFPPYFLTGVGHRGWGGGVYQRGGYMERGCGKSTLILCGHTHTHNTLCIAHNDPICRWVKEPTGKASPASKSKS